MSRTLRRANIPPFYKLTKEEFLKIRKLKLSPNARDLYWYIQLSNPFGDRYLPLDIETAMNDLCMSKASVYEAHAQLLKHDLIDSIPGKLYVKPKSSENKIVQESGIQSRNLESSPEIWNSVQESGIQSRNLENQSLKALPDGDRASPQTNKTIQTDQIDQIEREGEVDVDPEYQAWISRRVDRFPEAPAFREQVEELEAAKISNQRAFRKWKEKRDKTKSSAHSQQGPIFENAPIPDSLEMQIARARARWIANPKARADIKAWAELEGVPIDESGCPCVVVEDES
jgi:hypothetical protein